MGILVQDNLAINHCLERFSEAYKTSDFEDISETLAENCLYESQAEGKTLNEESRIVVNKDGNDIIVF